MPRAIYAKHVTTSTNNTIDCNQHCTVNGVMPAVL